MEENICSGGYGSTRKWSRRKATDEQPFLRENDPIMPVFDPQNAELNSRANKRNNFIPWVTNKRP